MLLDTLTAPCLPTSQQPVPLPRFPFPISLTAITTAITQTAHPQRRVPHDLHPSGSPIAELSDAPLDRAPFGYRRLIKGHRSPAVNPPSCRRDLILRIRHRHLRASCSTETCPQSLACFISSHTHPPPTATP